MSFFSKNAFRLRSPEGVRKPHNELPLCATAQFSRPLELDELPNDNMLVGHSYNVASVAWNADGKTFVTASYDHTARIWDANTGALIDTLLKVDLLNNSNPNKFFSMRNIISGLAENAGIQPGAIDLENLSLR